MAESKQASVGLTLENIEKAIAYNITESGGIRPAAGAGKIKYGQFKNKITWYAVNAYLIRYANKNPDCGFTSLFTFIEKLDKEGRLPEMHRPERASPPGRPATPIDITNIISMMRQTLATGRKILPAEKIEITGLWHGKYWSNIDRRLPDFGFKDIKDLMDKSGIENRPAGSELPEIRLRTAGEILDMTRDHIRITNHLPPIRSGLLRDEFSRASVSLVNKDLRNGRIEGLSEIFGKAHPASFETFLIGTGLAKPVDGLLRLVNDPQP